MRRVIDPARVTRSASAAAALATPCMQALDRDGKGRPKRTLGNVMTVLSLHEDWAGVLVYDSFAESVVARRQPPTRASDSPSSWRELREWPERQWSDDDTARTVSWLGSEIGIDVGTMLVDTAVNAVAHQNEVHPVREYFSGLTWDRTPRLHDMLHRYFCADDSEYTSEVGRRWMISAVARVYQPGCQADCMLVLESQLQGIGKSTGLAILGGRWFSDTPIVLGEKDSYQALRGVLIYEFGELANIRGREVERVKGFVSARSDHYRPSYGRRAQDFPRQCVFAGTTNESSYLEDMTGNRRFWPVACSGDVDRDALAQDRDQLWAEATSYYHDGAPWYLDERRLIQRQVEATLERSHVDPWQNRIACVLAARPNWEPTTAELLTDVLEMKLALVTRAEEIRIGRVLRSLEYFPKQVREGNLRIRRYCKKQAENDVTTPAKGCDDIGTHQTAFF